LYIFLANDVLNSVDLLGSVDVKENIVEPKKIDPKWVTGGPFIGDKGLHAFGFSRVEFKVRCTCCPKISKIKCKVTIIADIFLNFSQDSPPPADSRGNNRGWGGVYGHEQLHVIGKLKAMEAPIKALENAPHPPITLLHAVILEKNANEELEKAWLASAGHSGHNGPFLGDPNLVGRRDPRPSDGIQYQPRTGSPDIVRPNRGEPFPNAVFPEGADKAPSCEKTPK
jgi:hypothetical protein